MSARVFGTLKDGREVRAFGLTRPDGLKVEVLEYGAVIRAVSVPTAAGHLTVTTGLEDLAAYEADRQYHGAIVGRCANRIGGARFGIDGAEFKVAPNEGSTCLHGGPVGLSRRLWKAIKADGRGVTLAYASPDGEEGFPGAIELRITIQLLDRETLEILWEAATDRPTPVNLSHHLYFNLEGAGSKETILDHSLAVAAGAITPVDRELIPTGQRLPVKATPFDFRKPQRIGAALAKEHPQLEAGGGYDHNWILDGRAPPAVRLKAPRSGVTLEITTDQPGLQIYGGQGLSDPFKAHGALAIEPQGYPDAMNHAEFPSVLLRPGEMYRKRASYRFSTAPAPTAGAVGGRG